MLERRDILGGAAATEETWPGYRISSASYVVSLMPDRIVDELELKRFGYEVSIISPDYFVPFPDGTSLTLWGDMERDCANIARLNAATRRPTSAFDRYFERVAGMLKELLFVVPPNMALSRCPGVAQDRWASSARWTGRDIHELVRLFTMSAADFLDEWFEDARVKGAMATQAIIGAWCGPMTPGSAYVLMHHWIGEIDGHFGAWGWVKGGMGGVERGRWRARRRRPARRSAPSRMSRASRSTREGRAVGVELDDGSLIRAKRVVSNAHPKTTYLDLVGRERLPDEVVRDVERFRTRSGSVKINVGLTSCRPTPSWDQEGDVHKRAHGRVAVHGVPGAGVRRREVRARVEASVRRGDVPHRARADGLAPEGKHVMMAFTQYGPVRAEARFVGQGARCVREARDRRRRRVRAEPARRRSSTSRC